MPATKTDFSQMTDEELIDILLTCSDYYDKIIRKLLSDRNGYGE